MFRDPPVLPHLPIHDGARLFVVTYPLQDPPVSGLFRSTFYGLAWLSGGAATFVCDTEKFAVKAGSLVWTIPGQVYWWEQPEPGAHLTLIGFLPELLTGGALNVHLIPDLPFLQPDGPTVIPVSGEAGEVLSTLFQQIWHRYAQVAEHHPANVWLTLPRQREALMLAYLHGILAEVATLTTGVLPTPLTQAQSADLRLTQLFRTHAATGARERRPVRHYAELLHVTPGHLTRVVGRVMGKTPSAWLQEQLLLDAKRLLAFTDRSVERIAEDLHFPSATQFSQWFRGQSGQTPRQVRQGSRESTFDFQQF